MEYDNPIKERILFVDDDQNILHSYQRLMAPHFDVSLALGGAEALELIKNEEPFTVIVSDIKMPRMSGIEFLEESRHVAPNAVRMVLTGYADLETAVQAVNKGDIFRFLTKPCKSEEMLEALKAAANQHRMARFEQELVAMTRLNRGLEKTLRSFIRLVEFRDPYTAGHMERTAVLASMLAERLGVSDEGMRALNLASLVHDVGKIAVPTSILNKPRGLTDAEIAIIRTHVIVGADVMGNLETLWPISRIIAEHHERLDGSGYPNALRGDQLLIESKILSVADVTDALLTTRPYRPKLSKDETINLLNELRVNELDPDATECVISLLSDGALDEVKQYDLT